MGNIPRTKAASSASRPVGGAARPRASRGLGRAGRTITIEGVEYVLLAKAELERLRAVCDEGSAVGHGANSERQHRLYRARTQAGLTQAQLARRLGKSQTLVSQAETGLARVSERYVESVLQACGLSKKWGVSTRKRRQPTGWNIPKEQIAGLDPETLVPVRRGSKRDKQLKRQYAWWGNW